MLIHKHNIIICVYTLYISAWLAVGVIMATLCTNLTHSVWCHVGMVSSLWPGKCYHEVLA